MDDFIHFPHAIVSSKARKGAEQAKNGRRANGCGRPSIVMVFENERIKHSEYCRIGIPVFF
jgi:hypothetical protein